MLETVLDCYPGFIKQLLKKEMLLFLNAIGFFSGLIFLYINEELSFIETFS